MSDAQGARLRSRFLIAVATACLVLLSGAFSLVPAAGGPVVVSETWRDIDSDGHAERIEILMLEGKRYRDAEQWCGNGEKWEGRFAIRVRKGRSVLSDQSLNALMSAEPAQADPLFFWTPRFALTFADYRQAGGHDFNLGQYRSCNGNSYQLFTVASDGRIRRLPVQGADGFFVSAGSRVNSTPLIRVKDGLVAFPYYDNTIGKLMEGRYRWDGSAFVPAAASPPNQ
jgi:hypothetical protein